MLVKCIIGLNDEAYQLDIVSAFDANCFVRGQVRYDHVSHARARGKAVPVQSAYEPEVEGQKGESAAMAAHRHEGRRAGHSHVVGAHNNWVGLSLDSPHPLSALSDWAKAHSLPSAKSGALIAPAKDQELSVTEV